MYNSTMSPVLDLFQCLHPSVKTLDVYKYLENAWREDPELSVVFTMAKVTRACSMPLGVGFIIITRGRQLRICLCSSSKYACVARMRKERWHMVTRRICSIFWSLPFGIASLLLITLHSWLPTTLVHIPLNADDLVLLLKSLERRNPLSRNRRMLASEPCM